MASNHDRPWDETVPTDSQSRTHGAQNNRYVKGDTRQRAAIDHVWGGSKELEPHADDITGDDSGFHQRVTLVDHVGTPPTNPPTGHRRVYEDQGDLKVVDSVGVVKTLTVEDDAASAYMRKSENLADVADQAAAQTNLLGGTLFHGNVDGATGALSSAVGIASAGRIGTGAYQIVLSSAPPAGCSFFCTDSVVDTAYLFYFIVKRIDATTYHIYAKDDFAAHRDCSFSIVGYSF